MKRQFRLGAQAALVLSAIGLVSVSQSPVRAQDAPASTQPAAILRQDFQKSEHGWTGFGDVAKAARTDDAKWVRSTGASALKFEYEVSKKGINGLLLPVGDSKAWEKAGQLHFFLKVETPTTIAVTLQEKGSGRWMALVTLAANTWQEVRLAPSDFQLATDANDPKDDNGVLDIDAIEGVGLFDLAQMFVQAEGPLAALLSASTGLRTLVISDFSVETGSLPEASLDGLARPQLGWMCLGTASISRVDAPELGGAFAKGAALMAKMVSGPGKIAGLVRPIRRNALRAAESITLTLAAEKSATLLVLIEDERGGKFQTTIEAPGDKKAKEFVLPLSAFTPSGDSSSDKLEKVTIKQIVIVDLTGIAQPAASANTLWITNVTAKGK